MQVTLVYIHVHEKDIPAFIEATRANHTAALQEVGNRRFDVLQQANDPARFILYEAYNSAKDAAAHKNTAHYLAWRDAVASMMASPRTGISYQGLLPEFLP